MLCSEFTKEDDGDVRLLFLQYSGQLLRGNCFILPANKREMSPMSFAIMSLSDTGHRQVRVKGIPRKMTVGHPNQSEYITDSCRGEEGEQSFRE